MRMSLCDTIWVSLYRLSRSGLKIWTLRRAIWARRNRRMSSSVFPLNMLPVITSIQPCCGGVLTRRALDDSDSRLIFARFRVDADPVALVDEGRHLDDHARLEGRGLDLGARSRALDA